VGESAKTVGTSRVQQNGCWQC